MSAAPNVALPDPETLEETRQAWVRERFAVQIAFLAAFLTAWVGAIGSVVVGVLLNAPSNLIWGVTAFVTVLPVAGMLGTALWHARRFRRGKREALAVLGVRDEWGFVRRGAIWGSASLLAVGVYVSVMVADTRGIWPFLLVMVVAGLMLSLIRRRMDPVFPFWAMALMTGWIWAATGVVAVVALWVPHLAPYVGIAALVLSPFGLPVVLLRESIVRVAGQDSVRGRLAGTLVAFLPPAQQARHAGRSDDALALLMQRLPILRGTVLAEALVEVGLALLEREDPRAESVFAAAAILGPGQVGPFAGLARCLREREPKTALAFAEFAEANAARGMRAADPELVALREALQEETRPRRVAGPEFEAVGAASATAD
jgi:hypothetical protein